MKLIIKIKRPEGHIEDFDASSKFAGMNDAMFAAIAKATSEAGKGECLSWSWVDDRNEADAAYDAVTIAYAKVEQAESASYYDPAKICNLRNQADKAAAEWTAKYPQAAAQRGADKAARIAAKDAEMQASAGYKAKLAGQD